MVTSAGSCRIGEVESVGTAKPVCVGGLLRLAVNLFYYLCEDLLEVGSLEEGSLMLG